MIFAIEKQGNASQGSGGEVNAAGGGRGEGQKTSAIEMVFAP